MGTGKHELRPQPSVMNEAQLQGAEAAQAPLEGGKYVYCIIRSVRQREFGGIGIGGGQRVYTVQHNDLAAVVREAVGVEPVVRRWTRPSDMVFDTAEEAIEFTARRLVLPPGRWPELEERLLPRLTGRAGHWQIEPTERELCTLWWRSNSPKGGTPPE